MGLIAALVVSFVALFSFATLPLFEAYRPTEFRWYTKLASGKGYEPARKGVIADQEGYAHRTADNTQMTRRDRGRGHWESSPNSQPSLRQIIAQTFGTKELTPFSSAPSAPPAATNFIPKNRELRLRIPAESLEPETARTESSSQAQEAGLTPVETPVLAPLAAPVQEPVSELPSLSEGTVERAPELSIVPASVEPIRQEALQPPPAVSSPTGFQAPVAPAAPLYQHGMETAPLAAVAAEPVRSMSPGRLIQRVIQEDPTLSEACKLTIKVSLIGDKVTLRGIVPSDADRVRLEQKAQEIAGDSFAIDNRLITLGA